MLLVERKQRCKTQQKTERTNRMKIEIKRQKNTNIPEGTVNAVCVDQYEKEMKGKNGTAAKLIFVFEVKNTKGNMETTEKRYPAEPSNAILVKDICTCFGDDIPNEPDTEQMVGKNCQLQIMHKRNKAGGKYASIEKIMKAEGALLKPSGNYIRMKDRKASQPAALPPASASVPSTADLKSQSSVQTDIVPIQTPTESGTQAGVAKAA
jgi:hypothetical protein